MSNRMNLFANIRLAIVLAMVFLISFLFTNIIGAPVITILVYFFIGYRRKIKDLQKQLADSTVQGTTQSAVIPPAPESPAPPISTDA